MLVWSGAARPCLDITQRAAESSGPGGLHSLLLPESTPSLTRLGEEDPGVRGSRDSTNTGAKRGGLKGESCSDRPAGPTCRKHPLEQEERSRMKGSSGRQAWAELGVGGNGSRDSGRGRACRSGVESRRGGQPASQVQPPSRETGLGRGQAQLKAGRRQGAGEGVRGMQGPGSERGALGKETPKARNGA